MPSPWPLALLVCVTGSCSRHPIEMPDAQAPPADLTSVSPPVDGLVPLFDGSGPRDLVSVVDLLPPPDIAGCAGGYLNSMAADACPLACSPLVESVPDEGAAHTSDFTTHVKYAHNPPASGMHWPSPAPWGKHDEVLPAEWWVHNLEHQGIVLLYNCPSSADGGSDGGSDGCPDVVAAFVALVAKHPSDTFTYYQGGDMYFSIVEKRFIITPDPTLPKRIAAVAWDWSYTSDTLDTNALECFINARYGRGPENAP